MECHDEIRKNTRMSRRGWRSMIYAPKAVHLECTDKRKDKYLSQVTAGRRISFVDRIYD